MPSLQESLGLSDEHWDRLSPAHRDLYALIRPLRQAHYRVDHPFSRIEQQLATYASNAESMGGRFDLCPDFQRGHVWDTAKQIAYMENVFRGVAPTLIRFNQRVHVDVPGDLVPYEMVCLDGLQRLTAMRAFMGGQLRVFGGLSADDLAKSPFDPFRYYWQAEVFDFTWRKDLLQFYLDLNSGGVVHSPEELKRVAVLRDAAEPPALPKSPSFRC